MTFLHSKGAPPKWDPDKHRPNNLDLRFLSHVPLQCLNNMVRKLLPANFHQNCQIMTLAGFIQQRSSILTEDF